MRLEVYTSSQVSDWTVVFSQEAHIGCWLDSLQAEDMKLIIDNRTPEGERLQAQST